jgi:IclR family KDG regulon transcriptional repressor
MTMTNNKSQLGQDGKYMIGVVAKTFELLDLFGRGPSELSLRELVSQLGHNESGTYRLAMTLVTLGILDRDQESKKFRIGARLFELGSLAAARRSTRCGRYEMSLGTP